MAKKEKTERCDVTPKTVVLRVDLEQRLKQLLVNKWLKDRVDELKDELIEGVCGIIGIPYNTESSYEKIYEINLDPKAELLSWSSAQPPWKGRFELLVQRNKEMVAKLEEEIKSRKITTVNEIINLLKAAAVTIPAEVEEALKGEKMFKPMIRFKDDPEPDLAQLFGMIEMYKDIE